MLGDVASVQGDEQREMWGGESPISRGAGLSKAWGAVKGCDVAECDLVLCMRYSRSCRLVQGQTCSCLHGTQLFFSSSRLKHKGFVL